MTDLHDEVDSVSDPFVAGALTSVATGPPDLPPLGDAPSDADFRLLAENLPTLCWIARSDGYIVWYNRRWHAYCGSTPEAMEGWGWRSVHDPAELPRVMERWTSSVAEGRPFEMVFPLRGADGVFRPFLTRISPMRSPDGRVARWFGVNTEISAQMAAETALGESRGMYAVLTEAMPQMVWSTRADGFHDFYNRRWYEFTGVPAGSTDGEGWSGLFHPDDQPRAWERWRRSLATGEPYEVEYRLRHRSGAYRWTLGRALPVRDAAGAIVRWIGTCTDIHDAKSAADQADLLSHELSHRIKNIFSIVAGLIALSARREPAAKPFARDLTERVAALSRAHEFTRPHGDPSRSPTGVGSLHGLLTELFRPYAMGAAPRVRIHGDDVAVDDRGATPLALLFHELATNAVKYGALSGPEGEVAVDVRADGDRIALTWTETGGPPIGGPPSHEGFGARLAALSVEQQMAGRLVRAWRPEGLVLQVELARSSLLRSSGAPGPT